MNRFVDPRSALGPVMGRIYALFGCFSFGTLLSILPAADSSWGTGKFGLIGILFCAPIAGVVISWAQGGVKRSTCRRLDRATGRAFLPMLAPWFLGVALWGLLAVTPNAPNMVRTLATVLLDSGGFLATVGAVLWLRAVSQILAEESPEPDPPVTYSGPGLNRFLDPYGALGPVRREVISVLVGMFALQIIFAWFALTGFVTVACASFILFSPDPSIFGPQLVASVGASMEEAKAVPASVARRVLVLIIVGFIAAFALDLAVVPPTTHHGHSLIEMLRPRGHWPTALFVLLGPITPSIYRIRRLSWLAWQAKIRPAGEM